MLFRSVTTVVMISLLLFLKCSVTENFPCAFWQSVQTFLVQLCRGAGRLGDWRSRAGHLPGYPFWSLRVLEGRTEGSHQMWPSPGQGQRRAGLRGSSSPSAEDLHGGGPLPTPAHFLKCFGFVYPFIYWLNQ